MAALVWLENHLFSIRHRYTISVNLRALMSLKIVKEKARKCTYWLCINAGFLSGGVAKSRTRLMRLSSSSSSIEETDSTGIQPVVKILKTKTV